MIKPKNKKKTTPKPPVKTGRPTKYDKTMCEKVLELMSKGKSIVQVAAEFNVSRETIYAWEKEHKEFSDTLSIGRMKSEAFWEEVLQEMAVKQNAVTNGNLALILKCRYRWTEKQDIGLSGDLTVDDVTSLTPEERRKRIADFIDKAKQ